MNNNIGPGEYRQPGQLKSCGKQEKSGPKSMSINTKDFGVLVFLEPTPVGFNSRDERFKGRIGKQPGIPINNIRTRRI